MKTILITFLCIISLAIYGQDKQAYQIFDSSGNKVEYGNALKELSKKDVIFFGELHNNAISHWLELEITKDVFEKNKNKIKLAFEMFESDNQLILDEYIDGTIPTKKFEADARLWKNYQTDYKPIVDFAAENKIQVIASNVPRRYAALVASKGLEALDQLTPKAKELLPPLPIAYDPEVACYKNMMKMMHMPAMKGKANDNLPKAQALKDATMAHFTSVAFEKGYIIIHFNGSYHSDNKQGIIWHLNQYKPKLKIGTITTVVQSDVSKLSEEDIGVADYIIAVPETMTNTY